MMPMFITPFIHKYSVSINNENIMQLDIPDKIDVLGINSYMESSLRKKLDSNLLYVNITTKEAMKQINVTRMRESMAISFGGRVSFLDETGTEYAYMDGGATLRRIIDTCHLLILNLKDSW